MHQAKKFHELWVRRPEEIESASDVARRNKQTYERWVKGDQIPANFALVLLDERPCSLFSERFGRTVLGKVRRIASLFSDFDDVAFIPIAFVQDALVGWVGNGRAR